MTDPAALAALRAEIQKRHGTVYRFWKAHQGEIPKSAIYTVLAGKYPGDAGRMIARIRACLDGRDLREEAILAAIRGAACGRCKHRSECARRGCEKIFEAQAQAAAAAVSQLG